MARLELSIQVDEAAGGAAIDGDRALPVVGTVRGEEGDAVPFVGWVELVALLQRAVS
ncbi:MAG TPA: hypothetical protein VF228_21740 [Iamia sp.]